MERARSSSKTRVKEKVQPTLVRTYRSSLLIFETAQLIERRGRLTSSNAICSGIFRFAPAFTRFAIKIRDSLDHKTNAAGKKVRVKRFLIGLITASGLKEQNKSRRCGRKGT